MSDARNEDGKLSMGEYGVAYIPRACATTSACAIHVAFHGCKQTLDDIAQAYVRETGLNTWAEANGFIVLYPQATKSLLGGNPNGCWDWWGYTGKEYATKAGRQMRVVARSIEGFRAGHVELSPLRP